MVARVHKRRAQAARLRSPIQPGPPPLRFQYAGVMRSFRVHVPAGLAERAATPLVLMFHGGGGSGNQFQNASSRMDEVADREGFITVYPDGSGVLRTWNGGGCCGYAVTNAIDDVGFCDALLDHLTSALCVDEHRIYASGMSNGGLMSHRLGCELSQRFAAIAPVAGTNMAPACAPARKLSVLQIHGSADGHVPWDGGEGCGPARVAFSSVPDTLAIWTAANGCEAGRRTWLDQGDGHCEEQLGCDEGVSVVLCRIEGGGHSWPGGDPPADLAECPVDGPQSSTFSASEVIGASSASTAASRPDSN